MRAHEVSVRGGRAPLAEPPARGLAGAAEVRQRWRPIRHHHRTSAGVCGFDGSGRGPAEPALLQLLAAHPLLGWAAVAVGAAAGRWGGGDNSTTPAAAAVDAAAAAAAPLAGGSSGGGDRAHGSCGGRTAAATRRPRRQRRRRQQPAAARTAARACNESNEHAHAREHTHHEQTATHHTHRIHAQTPHRHAHTHAREHEHTRARLRLQPSRRERSSEAEILQPDGGGRVPPVQAQYRISAWQHPPVAYRGCARVRDAARTPCQSE